jgi:hypothetical protein
MPNKIQCDACGIYFSEEDDHDFFRLKNSALPKRLYRFCDTSCLFKICVKEFLSKNDREFMARAIKKGLRRIGQNFDIPFINNSNVLVYLDYAYAKKNVRVKINTVAELLKWIEVHEFRCKNFDESDFALACDICETAYRPDLDQPPAIIVKTSPDALNSINVIVNTNIATPDLVPAMYQPNNFRLICSSKCLQTLLDNPFKFYLLGKKGRGCSTCGAQTERFFQLTIDNRKLLFCSTICAKTYFEKKS